MIVLKWADYWRRPYTEILDIPYQVLARHEAYHQLSHAAAEKAKHHDHEKD